jgi:hypothetical protein
MKKMSALCLGILVSMASFASFAPSRLTVKAEANSDIRVTVDGNRSTQQSGSAIVFDDLLPGYHSVNVYQLSERKVGMRGRRNDDYRLVYSTSLNIKPMFAVSILVNRFGAASIDEQPLRGGYNNGWTKPDKGWDNRGGEKDYGRNNRYDDMRTISTEDFFAAERVMDRENDNGRLLYAKRIMDDNYLSAEQVKELARFFSFDSNRLEFVKYAYSNTSDKSNYSVVCSTFSSSDGRIQAMNFIKACR